MSRINISAKSFSSPLLKRVLGSFLLFTLCSLGAFSQENLVPNPSFDILKGCPTDPGIGNGNSWYVQIGWNFANTDPTQWPSEWNELVLNTSGTPDLFDTCVDLDTTGYIFNYANAWATAPRNVFGYQYPRSGSAYTHIGYVHEPNGNQDLDLREVIFIPLKEKLKPGQGYCFEYYWSAGEAAGLAMSGPQVMFTSKLAPYGYQEPISGFWFNNYFEPQIVPQGIFKDTANWNLFSAEYIATGEEEYIHIGWFLPFDQMQYELRNNDMWISGHWLYNYFPTNFNDATADIFLDDISLIECDEIAQAEQDIEGIPNVFTPNGDGINDYYLIKDYLPENSTLSIVNRWGAQVFYSDNYHNQWDGTINGQPGAEGTYYAIFQLPSGKLFTSTVNLFR